MKPSMMRVAWALAGSPVSDDGRGLKLCEEVRLTAEDAVRPSVMTGVD